MERFLAGVEKRAFRMAEIATGNKDDALDILQDAMFRLVDKYAARTAEEWGPLFYTILNKLIIDWYRRNAIRRKIFGWLGSNSNEVNEDPIQLAKDEYGKTPEQETQANRRIELLEREIRNLSIRQQQAFMLRTLEGLDVKQTAQVMKCSESSVKTHYSRAVQVLRDKLADHYL